ncbi:unnamed protein product [Rotaria sp. Silwood1]|nr:unnamed protein product [Rotaria sp. Silwood1]
MENFELLMSYRYFISDLCQMIKRTYDEQCERRPSMVFRAEWIDQCQFDSLKTASTEKGHLISMNGFISTTTDRAISNLYANKPCSRPNVVPVVYEITIDPSRSCTEFACIEDISYHPEEKEVLFSIGAVFSIDSICDPVEPNHFYTVQLIACEYNESVIDDMKLKLRKYTQAELYILLIKYLIELEQYRTVRKSLINLLDNKHVLVKDDSSLAAAYNCMGAIYSRQKLFGDAMLYYKQALKYQVRLDSSNNNALAECYNNIGSVLLEQKYYYEALENFEIALRIQNCEPIGKQHLITIYTNMGRSYTSIENYNEAEKCFDKTEQLIQQDKKEIAYDALEKRLIEADAIFYAFLFKEQRDRTTNPHYYSNNHYLYADGYDNASKIYENILPFANTKLIKITKYRILTMYVAYKSEYLIWNVSFTNLTNLQPLASHTSELELLNLLGSFFVNKTLYDNKRYDLAMQCWKNTVRPMFYLNNNDDVVNNFVYESYNIAVAYFREQEPTSQTIFSLGILFALKGDIDDAISYLTQTSLNDRSDRLICSILLGNLHVLEKKFSVAVEHYSSALQFVDENDQYMKIELYLALADCDKVNGLQTLQNLENDMKQYGNELDDDIIKLRSIIYQKIAYELIKNTQYDSALSYADKAESLKLKYLSNNHPDLAKSYILIGKIYAEKQNYRQALEQYEKANEIQHVNLSNDHMDIVKLKLEIGYIHCQMKKFDKLPQSFHEKIEFYSQIEYWASAIKFYHFASEIFEKEHKYDDAYQYEFNSVLIRQYQWPEDLVVELLYANTEELHTIEELKQLLPTSKVQLKTILQNFYHVFTQCKVILERQQATNNSDSDKLKDCNDKLRNVKTLLFLLWSSEEKQKYVSDDLVNGDAEWQLVFNRETVFYEIEYKFEFLLRTKASISLDIFEKEKDIAQFLSIFLYDLFAYYKFENIDEKAIEDIPKNFNENSDECVDENTDKNVDETREQKSSQHVENLLREYINYGKECVRINNLVDAAKIFIRALEVCEHFFKLLHRPIDNNDD